MIISEEKTETGAQLRNMERRKISDIPRRQIGNARVAVERNISKARSTYAQLNNKLFSTNVRTEYKLHVFQCIIEAAPIYGLKEIVINYSLLRKLDFFVLCKLKSITGYKFDEKVSYDTIKKTIENFNIKHNWPSKTIKKRTVAEQRGPGRGSCPRAQPHEGAKLLSKK